MANQSQRFFCFGLGYSALRLGRALAKQGWEVGGTVRDTSRAAGLARQGIAAKTFDRDKSCDISALIPNGPTHLLISMPPHATGERPLIEALAPHAHSLTWIGYLSSTGVYGDHDGAWVDENTAVQPLDARTQRRADAEAEWRDAADALGLPVRIFRLAGIYGPGRSVLDQLRSGTARHVIKEGHYFSRIHVDDIVRCLTASMNKPTHEHRVYNVCDDAPAPAHEVLAYAAKLLGVPLPPALTVEQAGLSDMAASFYAANRRVGNQRMKEDFGTELAYPTYREGLSALLRAEGMG